MHYRLGIDVGGTFTDFYLLNETGDQRFTLKVSSTAPQEKRGRTWRRNKK
jgi:N-methylhydantoinase A/oxoprolinase/acetone carboxylase beta subunit